MNKHQHRSGRSRVAIIVFGTVLLLGGVFLGSVLLRTSEFTTRTIELKQAGLPTSGVELNDFYSVPADQEDTTKLWLSACAAVRTKTFMDAVADLPILGRGDEIPVFGQEWPGLGEATEALQTTVKTELESVRQAATAGGRARFPVDFKQGINTLLNDTQEMRTLARLLCLDAQVAAREGDSKRVLYNILGVFAISDALAEEPTIVSQLVRLAIHNVAIAQVQQLVPHCNLDDAQLASLQEAIVGSDLRRGLFVGYVGERAIGLDAIGEFAPAPFRADNKLVALDIYEEALKNHDATWSEIQTYQTESAAKLKNLSGSFFSKLRYSAVGTLLGALSQAMTATVRTEASQRSAILALGAIRQRLNDGQYPSVEAGLPEGLPGVSNDATTDPFSSKPMLVTKELGKLIFYSVGENGIDDGGQVEHTSGRVPDIGFRLLSTD